MGITDPDNRNGNPYTTDRNTAPDMEVHHRQPLRFGLSLRYRIDDRWSLEAGLAYTRLISDITTTRKRCKRQGNPKSQLHRHTLEGRI